MKKTLMKMKKRKSQNNTLTKNSLSLKNIKQRKWRRLVTYSENPISEGKLIKSYDDLREKTLEFARSILSIELEIRELKNQIKEIRKDAKLDGVAVGLVQKCLSEMKRQKRLNQKDNQDLEAFLEVLGESPEVLDSVERLI